MLTRTVWSTCSSSSWSRSSWSSQGSSRSRQLTRHRLHQLCPSCCRLWLLLLLLLLLPLSLRLSGLRWRASRWLGVLSTTRLTLSVACHDRCEQNGPPFSSFQFPLHLSRACLVKCLYLSIRKLNEQRAVSFVRRKQTCARRSGTDRFAPLVWRCASRRTRARSHSATKPSGLTLPMAGRCERNVFVPIFTSTSLQNYDDRLPRQARDRHKGQIIRLLTS